MRRILLVLCAVPGFTIILAGCGGGGGGTVVQQPASRSDNEPSVDGDSDPLLVIGTAEADDATYYQLPESEIPAAGRSAAQTNTAPKAVTLNTPTGATQSSLDLSWTKSTDTDFYSYQLRISSTSSVGPSSTLIGTYTSKIRLTKTVTGLTVGTTYYFRVYVCDTGGLCTGCLKVSGTTPQNTAPKAVKLNAPANPTTSSLDLSWTQSTDSDFASYRLYRSSTSSVTKNSTLVGTYTSKTRLTKTITNLSSGIMYYFRIYVCDTAGFCTGSLKVSGGIQVCGNGIVETNEQCDDGNAATEACTYGQTCVVCSSSCQSEPGITSYCGDGKINGLEACDDGTYNGQPYYCNSTCSRVIGSVSEYPGKTFGGRTGYSKGFSSVWQTSDAGYILSGYTSSFNENNFDLWVSKLDSHGDQVWNKTFGNESYMESASSVQETSDGGYIVSGSIGTGTNADIWLLKLDSSGKLAWENTFGGTNGDGPAFSLQDTSDGGYIVVGQTKSFGAGNGDVWLLKIDSSGNQVWNKTYGGSDVDYGSFIEQTEDGGYILSGTTTVPGKDRDFLILKLDSSGNVVWEKNYGGSSFDIATSVQQTDDGGYVVAGTRNYDTPEAGWENFWIIKTDSLGDLIWDKSFGGAGYENAKSIRQTAEGGYIVAGDTTSIGAGEYDIWVFKLDSSGNQLWSKTFGSTGYDYSQSMQLTADGGCIIAGSIYNSGSYGYIAWVLKLDSAGNPEW